MNGLGEPSRLGEIRRRRLAPEQIRVRRVRLRARNGALDAATETEETLRCALADTELAVARIDVAREQLGAIGVRAGDENCRNIEHVGREPRRDQGANEL